MSLLYLNILVVGKGKQEDLRRTIDDCISQWSLFKYLALVCPGIPVFLYNVPCKIHYVKEWYLTNSYYMSGIGRPGVKQWVFTRVLLELAI